MNTPFVRLKRIAIFLAGISVVSAPALVRADWSIIGLGADTLTANAINDSGQIVGVFNAASTGGNNHAFITDPGGEGIMDLGTIGGLESVPFDVNDSGQVVGWSFNSDNVAHAFITGPNGVGMIDLGPGNGDSSFANAINNSGQVTGGSLIHATEIFQAYITGPNGVGMTVLDSDEEYADSIASGINDSGQVTGQVIGESFGSGTFMTGPNGVGITVLNIPNSFGVDINDSGQVVGGFHSSILIGGNYPEHAFVTGPNGTGFTDLGTLGGLVSTAVGINDSGEVVGSSTLFGDPSSYISFSSSNIHAFIFSHGVMTDLSLLDVVVDAGWTDLRVMDINNNGQIVGFGNDSTGHPQAFLLSHTNISQVPEPEIYMMMFAGLGVVGLMARRRKNGLV